MKPLTELDTWKTLKSHAEHIQLNRIATLQTPNFPKYPLILRQQGIQIDFCRQHLSAQICDLLIKLAKEQRVEDKIAALMQGASVNSSECRPALHTALRAKQGEKIIVDGRDIMANVVDTREQMRAIAEQIRAANWYGYSGKPITDIVNIGIGGSDFGPRFCIDALKEFTAPHLSYHFISDADPNAFKSTVQHLQKDTTLFIVSSKSFTTQETLLNAQKAFDWFGDQAWIAAHFIAVTAHVGKAKALGIQHVLPLWDWVGGRFSFCSAINLIGCIALGFDQFMDMLAGARYMDEHFQTAPMAENMPIMLGLVGIWNINFLHIPSLLLMVYARQLEKFVPYIQQLDMESNGKSIDMMGRSVNYATGPLVWGGMGNQAQHSYFQLLCQGSHAVASDFISVKEFDGTLINDVCRAKMDVLSYGIHAEGSNYIPGGLPLNHIQLDACTPYNLGSLVALYEHKTYAQGVIWNINVFDQPGVESAKRVLFDKAGMMA